jgi:GH15 family glucan-1,4-alpha-glucosidase
MVAPSGIGEYAVIGDCRAAALVSHAGSIDWLCWPRFDSPALFAAILDPRAGRFSIAPRGEFSSRTGYLADTNVVQTCYTTASGALRVTDFMPVLSEDDKRHLLTPEHEVIRILECTGGEVEVEALFEPRPDFGRITPRMRVCGRLGIVCDLPGARAFLQTEIPLELDKGIARGACRMRAGQRTSLSLSYSQEGPAVLSASAQARQEALARTCAWWRNWAGRARYHGPHRDAVIRSALLLKLLVYAPSGAMIAAPTTSLPERIGGDLNWDYRYCWLRDASLTTHALLGLGYQEEARAFASWLLHATRLTRPRLMPIYDVFGNLAPKERNRTELAGLGGSRPVRVGNDARHQVQLDVYGEVIAATAQLARSGFALDRETRRLLISFGEYVCDRWRVPDAGIWEPRGEAREHTHSRLLCWVALDQLIALHAAGILPKAPIERFAAQRDELRREIEQRAWNARLGSYVSVLDGDQVDASLLLLACHGFEDPGSARMRATYARIVAQLAPRDGLLYRYVDSATSEGAFGICGFWGAEFVARGGGEPAEAERLFEAMLRYRNRTGLFAEEIDPQSGAPLGNFPQAFSHIGLINCAMRLNQGTQTGARP